MLNVVNMVYDVPTKSINGQVKCRFFKNKVSYYIDVIEYL